MTGWTNREYTIKRQPNAHMRGAGCGLVKSLSPTNALGDRFTTN